jgi:hypothetical protein
MLRPAGANVILNRELKEKAGSVHQLCELNVIHLNILACNPVRLTG